MGHGKLKKFAENETFRCLLQPDAASVLAKPEGSKELILRDHAIKGRWNSDMFEKPQPIVVELGCGKGDYTIALARRHPEMNFIGVDIKGARLWKGAKEATEDALGNVAFLRTRIEFIDAFFGPSEVSEIWLTFSDPQLRGSENARLTSPLFLQRYSRFLRPGGIVHLKTDSRFLYEYTQSVIRANDLEVLAFGTDIYHDGILSGRIPENRLHFAPTPPIASDGPLPLTVPRVACVSEGVPPTTGVACRFYHISTDEVYGALEITDPEGVEPPFTTKASSGKHHLAYGTSFFTEDLKYQPHSPYSAAKASSDHFVRAYHDTYGMPTVVTNCSNNYGPYQFPEKLIPLFINNIRHRKPLPVYGKGENVRDWLYVEDHARAIDLIFHEGKIAETYNIGGFNEWKNIELIKVLIATVDRLLGRPEGADLDLITYVTDRAGHDLRYAIDSTKLQRELGWEPSLQFEEGIEKTVRWYLDNQAWMDNVTSGDYQKYYDDMYKNR